MMKNDKKVQKQSFLTTVIGWLIDCVDYLNFLHSLNIYYGGSMDLNNIFFEKDDRIKIGGVNFNLQRYAPNFGVNGQIGHINDFDELSDEQIRNDFNSLGLAFADLFYVVNIQESNREVCKEIFIEPLLIRPETYTFDPHQLFSNLLYIFK